MYEAGRGKFHPFPHELEVQSFIRDLRPPITKTSTVRLGFLGGDLVAVICMLCLYEPATGVLDSESLLLLQALAVSNLHKRMGYGKSAMEEAIRVADLANWKHAYPQGGEPTPLLGRVHEDNAASQGLLQSYGFVYDTAYAEGLHLWIRDEPLW